MDCDKIDSYEQFSRDVKGHLQSSFPSIFVHLSKDHVLLYKLKHSEDASRSLAVSLTIRVYKNMSLSVWISNTKLVSLDWILSHTQSRLLFWSQLYNIVSRYSIDTPDVDVTSTSKSLAKDVEAFGVAISKEECCNFLAEQIRLLCAAAKGRRYSIDMLIYAFNLYHKSPACYEEVKKVLILPSKHLIRDISSNFRVDSGNVCQKYLKSKASLLQPNELKVNIQLDEIHIKSNIVYQNGKLLGCAENHNLKSANRIQCFMLSSIFSDNRDVVSLVPVQQMTSKYLCDLTRQVISNVTKAGYTIVSIISDNNVVNRKMFMSLSDSDHLVPYIINPVNKIDKIFILFDSVHILKCIRNNWINLKNFKKTFTFPGFDDNNIVFRASFADLEHIYEMEKSLTIKQAYRLTWKALHPHSIERQNVKLALRIFNESNVAALKCLDQDCNWNGTALFIDIILKLWNILNVKSVSKGWSKRLEDAFPFYKSNDKRLEWMSHFILWLKRWKEFNDINGEGFLTKETYLALSHTVTTIVQLIQYLLIDCDMSYVLLGKFQTDNLESRFGNYRQLSGSNYLVSVKEVLQSEKKLKVKSLLNLFSSNKGTITIRDYLINFSDEKQQRCDNNFVSSFPYNNISKQNKIDDLSPLLLVSGYVAHKSMLHISCEDCKLLFGDKDKPLNLEITSKHLQYFDCLNRGGLTYPSNLLFSVLQCAYIIFNMCISEDLEELFLKVYNQKYTLIGVIERYITSHDDFGGIFVYCDKCETEWHLLLIKAIGCFVNVLLNDYSIDKTNINSCAKVARKVSKFN